MTAVGSVSTNRIGVVSRPDKENKFLGIQTPPTTTKCGWRRAIRADGTIGETP